MSPETLAPVLGRLKRSPLVGDHDGHAVAIGPAELRSVLPHRPPLLLLESMAQLGLVLLAYLEDGSSERNSSNDRVPPPLSGVRFTKVHHASFVSPALPGDELTLHTQALEHDLTLVAAAQAWCGDRLVAYSISEAYIDEA